MENNQINNSPLKTSIKTVTELISIIEKLNGIKQKLELMSKEEIDLNLQEQFNYYSSMLGRGIVVDISDLKEEIFIKMETYFKTMDLPINLVRQIIDQTKIFVSDINLIYNGKFATYSNKIGIDYRFAKFDPNGNFIGINQDSKDLTLHALIHEFLHRCSSNKNNLSVSSDALSEGFTDMFAINILSSSQYASKMYSFFVKLCKIFTEMIGIKNMLNDYINNAGEFPTIQKLFSNCGLSEESFSLFYAKCNKVLSLIEKKQDSAEIEKLEIELVDFLKEYIISPYYNFTNNIGLIELFNNEFSENKFDTEIIEDLKERNK